MTKKALGPGDDVEMINTEELWPHWPVLPVKKRTNGPDSPECGVIASGNLTTVRMLNIFMGWTKEQFDNAKTYEYASVEELVADGWVVD